MNKFKKVELQKHRESREGLTPEQIKVLDEQETIDAKVDERARAIHAYLFDEEYAFMYRDTFGEPRPSPEDIVRKNAYRKAHGLPLLDDEGKSPDFQQSTMDHCLDLARKEIVEDGFEDSSPLLKKLEAELEQTAKNITAEQKPFSFRASKPYMPGKFDAVYLEKELGSGCRLVVFDDDPYRAVTVLQGDEPLFTLLCGDLNETVSYIESNLECLVRGEI